MFAFLMPAGLSGLGGLVGAAQIGVASPTLAPKFLLSACAAVFLGRPSSSRGGPTCGDRGGHTYGMFLLAAVGISVSQGNRRLSRMIRRTGRKPAQP
ncbi:hypothetical protein J7E69_19670 [Rhodococcus enclensis]|nr:hypothetical protein [Rhodococcus qingshengii]